MSTFFDITIREHEEFDTFLAKALTREDVIRILADPVLATDLTIMLQGRLASASLPNINWAPVNQYPAKLGAWNTRFSLGLTELDIEELAARLSDHSSPSQPTSISLTLGRGLLHDHKVVMQILEYELDNLGVVFADRLDITKISYLPGSEPTYGAGAHVTPAPLDIGTYWDPQHGVAAKEVLGQHSRWPTHEVALLLALNPHIYRDMDQKTIPFMVAAGLIVTPNQVPCFRREPGVAYVDGGWDGNPWRSIVAFREG